MAKQESFKTTCKGVQDAFNNSKRPTREEAVRGQMVQIQVENEQNFLKQFRENDFKELVALMGGELENEIQ